MDNLCLAVIVEDKNFENTMAKIFFMFLLEFLQDLAKHHRAQQVEHSYTS